VTEVTIRRATEDDLRRIVELIHLGAVGGRGTEDLGEPLPERYYRAFRDIETSGFAAVYVADADGSVVGTFSLAFLPNISNGGWPVAQIESVHVAEAWRSRGVGEQMLRRAIELSKAHGCKRLQLTSNKARSDAHRFYERLGFQKSHEGMKLALD
jgi:GNAT superfamily N-acetyltransferase